MNKRWLCEDVWGLRSNMGETNNLNAHPLRTKYLYSWAGHHQALSPSFGSWRKHSAVHHISETDQESFLETPCETKEAAPCRSHTGIDNSFPQRNGSPEPELCCSHGPWKMLFLFEVVRWPQNSMNIGSTGTAYQTGGQIVIQSVLSVGQMSRMCWCPGLICDDLSRVATRRKWHPARKASSLSSDRAGATNLAKGIAHFPCWQMLEPRYEAKSL